MDIEREKFNRPEDEGEEVEAHKFVEDETKREKFVDSPADVFASHVTDAYLDLKAAGRL